MKRKYLGALFIWLAVGLSVSGYFKFSPPEHKLESISFFYKKTSDRNNRWESRHSEVFFQATLIGSFLILGVGFFDKPK